MTAPDDPVDAAAAEFAEKWLSGERPGIEEFCRERAALGPALRRALEDFVAAASAFDLGAAGGARGEEERVLGDFRLVREIGRGGMGVVFEAEQLSLRRRVAVKVLPNYAHWKRDAAERFQREAEMAARLRHPAIVEVFTVGRDGDTHYFAMELLEGESLERRIRSEADRRAAGAPDTRERIVGICGIVASIADALEFAHRQGVVHRDVKPSNIMVRPDGSAVLTDFGVARAEDMPTITEPGAVTGTSHYLSPEQARPSGAPPGPASDVFSLGVTLYEALTLRRPFDGATSAEIVSRILGREPESARRLNPKIPPDLATIAETALQKDPKNRYASAAALAADLRAFLASRPIAARPTPPLARAARWARREPARAALAASLAIGIPTIAILAGVWWGNAAAAERGRAQARAEKIDADLEQGYLLLGSEKGAGARAAFERVLAEEPDHAEALAGIASVLALEGRFDEVAPLLEAHPRALESHRVFLRWQADALRGAGKPAEAAALERGLPEPATSVDWFLEGARLLARADSGDPSVAPLAVRCLSNAVHLARAARALHWFCYAHAAGHANDHDAAEESARTLAALWPDSARAQYWIGFALAGFDRARSLAAYTRANELDPTHPRTHTNLGSFLADAGDSRGAAEEYRRALALDPNDARTRRKLGTLLQRAGDARGALEALAPIPPADPALAKALFNIGNSLREAGDLENAKKAYARAIEHDPKLAAPRVNLGVLHHLAGRLDEALEQLSAAAELEPRSVDAQLNLGNCRAKRQEWVEAEAALRRAAALAPAHETVHKNLMGVLRRLGDTDALEAERARFAAARK